MKLHIIGTVNGMTNEGMRNVATHLARGFEKHHPVRYSTLKNVGAIYKNSLWADVTVVFARANTQLYWLMRVVQRLCKNVWLVSVQRPMDGFLRRNDKHPLRCDWLYLSESDIQPVRLYPGKSAHFFRPGINLKKFTPVDAETQTQLKRKYGFDPARPVAIHVGHCSAGRGLEAFCDLDKDKYQRLAVVSGMFEDEQTVSRLEADGVTILRGYLEYIQEIYQMADLYLFPTRSNEYVISVPLSVMEALACGTPAVGFRDFPRLQELAQQPEDMVLVRSPQELTAAADSLMSRKRPECLLRDPHSWDAVAEQILKIIRSAMK